MMRNDEINAYTTTANGITIAKTNIVSTIFFPPDYFCVLCYCITWGN